MNNSRNERLLEIFFCGLRGEDISVRTLADSYEVSAKSITRNINDLKAFLANHRELVGNTELEYSYRDKCYRLHMDNFLTNDELFALVKILIGVRALSKVELLDIIGKLKKFTTPDDRPKMDELIRRETYHYSEIKHDCSSVKENLWKLVNVISAKKEITIDYYRMDRTYVTHRIIPASLMFSDYYFYLIAFKADAEKQSPVYFRVDRIKQITEHRSKKSANDTAEFDEGLLRQRSLLMWPGKLRTIRFEFSGPSLQAVLDKLPTARIIERMGCKTLIEAEVYGDGIKMWLLSQGSWARVVSPPDFIDEIKDEIEKMYKSYFTK